MHILITRERNGHIFTSGLKSDVTIVFLDQISYKTRERRGFENISGRYRLKWPKMGRNRRRGAAVLTPTNSFLLLGVITFLAILAKIDEEMRPRECARTQTGFIICPML